MTVPDNITGEQVIQRMEEVLFDDMTIDKAVILRIEEPQDASMIEFTDPWGNG
jgi:hypothetical protein